MAYILCFAPLLRLLFWNCAKETPSKIYSYSYIYTEIYMYILRLFCSTLLLCVLLVRQVILNNNKHTFLSFFFFRYCRGAVQHDGYSPSAVRLASAAVLQGASQSSDEHQCGALRADPIDSLIRYTAQQGLRLEVLYHSL